MHNTEHTPHIIGTVRNSLPLLELFTCLSFFFIFLTKWRIFRLKIPLLFFVTTIHSPEEQ